MKVKLIWNIFICVFILSGCDTMNKIGKPLPNSENGTYNLRLRNQIMEVDPYSGARIKSLKLDGKDFLTDSTVNNFNWGSTFWLSPQSDWNWPPSAEINNKAYTVNINNDQLIMISPKDPKTGIVVKKLFSVNKKTDSFKLQYILSNLSDRPQKVAPWEVTRVHINGLAFFPYGKGDRRGGLAPFTSEKEGINWYQYRANQVPLKGDRQLYSDGAEGWLAAVNGDMILIKKFQDIPFEKNAPNEGEIEWYASPVVQGKSYVEIEHQGAYEELKPGESVEWQVEWFLRKLPSTIKREEGNSALVNYVRTVVD